MVYFIQDNQQQKNITTNFGTICSNASTLYWLFQKSCDPDLFGLLDPDPERAKPRSESHLIFLRELDIKLKLLFIHYFVKFTSDVDPDPVGPDPQH